MTSWKKAYEFFTRDLWRIDIDVLSGPRGFLVKTLRLLAVSSRDFSEGLINLRAMSLVYTTLLSLVPFLAVTFSALKGFGVHNQIEPVLLNFLEPLGPKGAEISASIIGFVENLNVKVLGAVGLAFLLYTVFSLIQKIENAFNDIWRVRRQRSLARKISDYMSVLLIGPVLIFSGLGLAASIMGTTLMQKAASFEVMGGAMYAVGKIVPFLIVWGAFSFIYLFVPGTRVRLRSALTGGFCAAAIWETAGLGFASFIVSSTKYAAIYSGFAILILFMIWVYLSWLILLFGAQVGFYHQYPHFLYVRKEAILLNSRMEEKLALVIMALIGERHYYSGPPWNFDQLLDRLKLPMEPVQEVLERLEKSGLVTAVSGYPTAWLPAQDIEKITLEDVVRAVSAPRGHAAVQAEEKHLSLPGVDEVSDRIEAAVAQALEGRTVRDLAIMNAEEHEPPSKEGETDSDLGGEKNQPYSPQRDRKAR